MDVAAENGRVDVVELLCEHAKQSSEVYYSKYRPASKRSNALSLAISGGHVGVVRALLTPVRLHWDVGAAFELALAEGHQKVVTFMHRALPMYLAATKIGENYDMIVHMARDGHLRSVEYLFEHGHDSLSVAGKTFYIAAVYQRTKIISFLLGTGRVCPKAFDAAFERVCHSGLLDMVELLYMYEKKRASIESIRRAFVNARTLQVIRFLYLKEDIPQDCLHTLVEACIQRMDSKTNSHNQNQKECARILEFLFNQGRIPETLVTRTVEAAATSNTARLVGVFCKRGRVSLEVAAKAFTAAANSDSVDVVEVMWTKRLVSRETMMQALMSAASAAVFTVIAAFVSAHLLFPVPFFVLTLAPLFYTSYIVVFRILAGGRIFQHILASRVEFFRYIKFLVAENVVACTYPAYEALFRLAQGTHCQLPVIFLLPITKMALKNMMLQCAVQMEDMTPEAVIFTVDFFNAVYVSSCMQSATSLVSVVAIIATDLPQTAFMLYGLHQRTTSTRQRLRQVIGGSRNDNLLDAPCYLCQDPERFDRQTRMGIRIYSCLPHLLSTEKKALLDKLDQVPQTRDCRAPKASNCVRHWLWLSYRVEAIHPAVNDSEPATKTLASPMRIPGARKNSESFPTRRLALGESLETLFSLECIVVTAYLEAVTPIFYCCYVLVMVHLPSSQYHMELTGITSDNAGSKVQSLFVFGLFQIASFVVLALVIKRNCGIHALQHLAFVFETQTSLVQGKLMGWMVITLCFRVVHFGVDFTFQFCNLMN
ncbi:hypothetical protein PC123_g11370 [Phytophthora cactorum]|nr:hypothetical protein PC123_g11370 [Phytophthora cactorum]